MFQVKILHANQISILEELINMWLKEQTEVEVADIKYHSNVLPSGTVEHIAIMVYQLRG